MAKTTTAPKAEAKKRTILSPAERIAKLKAEAEALEQREKDKARAAMVKLEERSAVLVTKRDKINAEIKALGEEHAELSKLLEPMPTEDPAPVES